MTSLRRRLFFLLLPATAAIWLCAVAWIYLGSRSQLEHVLDTRLQEAARMVHSLAGSGDMQAAPAAPEGGDIGYARQLSCQIWSFDGRLVARSSGAPTESLAQGKQPPANLATAKTNNGKEDVPSVLVPTDVITKQNMTGTVIKDGFATKDQICTGQYASACKKAGIE